MSAGNLHYSMGHLPWDLEHCEGHLQTRGTAWGMSGGGQGKRNPQKSLLALWWVQGVHTISLCRATSLKFGCCSQLAHGALPESSQEIWDPEHWPRANPSQGFGNGHWSGLMLKRQPCALKVGGMCCCLSIKGSAVISQPPTSPEAADSPSPALGEGLLHPWWTECPASLVPYCNLNQTQPCSGTDHISPPQSHGKSSLAVLLMCHSSASFSATSIHRENFLHMWACLVEILIQQNMSTFLCLLLKAVTIEVNCWWG